MLIDQEKCKRDGHCVAVCPSRLLVQKEPDDFPTWIENAENNCINCGHCVAVCPHGALSLASMKPEDCPSIVKEKQFKKEEIETFLRSRRSIRVYQDKKIEEEKIRELIGVAQYAPTGGNSQLIKWLVINSPEQVRAIAGSVIDFMQSIVKTDHPLNKRYRVVTFIRAFKQGFDPIARMAPSIVITYAPEQYSSADADSSIALTFLDLAAPSFGLGTCWAGFVMRALKEWEPLQQMLELPEGHKAYGAMLMGYPKYKYNRLPLRNAAELIIKSGNNNHE